MLVNLEEIQELINVNKIMGKQVTKVQEALDLIEHVAIEISKKKDNTHE